MHSIITASQCLQSLHLRFFVALSRTGAPDKDIIACFNFFSFHCSDLLPGALPAALGPPEALPGGSCGELFCNYQLDRIH